MSKDRIEMRLDPDPQTIVVHDTITLSFYKDGHVEASLHDDKTYDDAAKAFFKALCQIVGKGVVIKAIDTEALKVLERLLADYDQMAAALDAVDEYEGRTPEGWTDKQPYKEARELVG